MATDTVQILISLKDGATQGLSKVNAALGGLRKNINGASKALFSLKGLLAGVGTGLLAKSFVDAANTAESYRLRLNALLRSQKEGNRAFKEMAAYAATVSYTYEEIMGSATQLAGVMRGGVDEIKQWMPMIADLAAVSGLSLQDTAEQIIRMYSVGAASADMFQKRGITAMLGFTAGVQYTAEETRKQLRKAFEDPTSQFRGAAANLARTWSGLISMMQDRWFQFRNLVMDAGVYDYIKAAVEVLLGSFSRLEKEGRLDAWAKNMATTVIRIFGSLATAAGWVGDAIRGVGMVINSVIAGASQLGLTATRIMMGLNYVLGRSNASLKENAQILRDTTKESLKKVEATATEEPYLYRVKRLLLEINAAVAKRKQLREQEQKQEGTAGIPSKPQTTGASKGKGVSELRLLQDELTRFNERMRTELAQLDATFTDTDMMLYYDLRVEKAQEAYQAELVLLEKMMDAAKTADDRRKLSLDIYKREQAYQRELIELEVERAEAVTRVVEKHKQLLKESNDQVNAYIQGVEEAQTLISGAVARSGIVDQSTIETANLEARQQEEQQRLLELRAKGYVDEQQLHKLHTLHILEQEQLAAKQREQIYARYADYTKSSLNNISRAFLDYYKATGEKHKEFFTIYKMAAIAETIISTYQAAQKMYASVAAIPYVGQALAPAAAATAIAAGMARVALIRSQQMAAGGLVRRFNEGGKIMGYSPTDTADNIPIQATAGEYIHPVRTVRHYGAQAMEAIRQRLVPPEVLSPFVHAGSTLAAGTHLAAGGMVAGSATSSYSVNVPITTIDTMDGLVGRLQDAAEMAVRNVLVNELG